MLFVITILNCILALVYCGNNINASFIFDKKGQDQFVFKNKEH